MAVLDLQSADTSGNSIELPRHFIEWDKAQRGAARSALRNALMDEENSDILRSDSTVDAVLEAVWNAIKYARLPAA